jgi:ankyrin repeat protein
LSFTALGIAARMGHTDIVVALVRAGAAVNYKDSLV